MQDWRATVSWLRGKINPAMLTLRLVVVKIPDNPFATGVEELAAWYYGMISDNQGQALMKAYMNLLRPLRELANDGLARFYANITHPWKYTEEARRRLPEEVDEDWEPDPDEDWEGDQEMALKERAERYVMGDRYESLYADDAEEPPLGDWEETWYDYEY
jgi:hypothetical protein